MLHHDLILQICEVAASLSALGLLGWWLRKGPSAPPVEIKQDTVAETATATPTVPAPSTPSLVQALKSTRDTFWGRIQHGMLGSSIPESQLEIIEEILYTSDLGPKTVERLLSKVGEQLSRKERQSLDAIKTSLKSEVSAILGATPRMGINPLDEVSDVQTRVWMIVGVNGAGKTTTIGKLAHLASQRGLRVLVAAGDTFRAAAQSQLRAWSERADVEIFSPEGVTDPGAVAYDAVQMARARKFDLVLIDTAGRLHTQDNLMAELQKVKRVVQKVDPLAPHQTIIVLDANSGQNALIQAEKFNEAIKIDGAIFTKMDGTAKGGVVLGLASQIGIPTYFLGMGESMGALANFRAADYGEALFESH